MSKQTIKEQTQAPEELSDILLVLDKKKNRIEAVTGVDDNGNLQTTEPKKSNLLDFMRIDKGDMIDNFLTNFWRRLKDPVSFRFFKSPILNMDEITKKIQAAIDNPTPEGKKLLETLEVKYDNKLKEKNMENTQKTNGQGAANEDRTAYRYNVEDIDWGTLDKLNLNRVLLEKSGQLDKLLKGYKSDGTYRIEGNFDGVVMKGDARLSLRNIQGQVVVMAHGVRVQPDLKSQFYGHNFTAEDRENLLKTGNMGRVAELNYSDGSKVKSLISIDKLTNEVVSFPVEHIKMREKFGGVKLTAQQKRELREGKAVLVEGMVNTQTGEIFSQHLQYNADAKKLVFVVQGEVKEQNISIGIPDEFRGKKFTEEEKKQLEDGKVIVAKDLINKEKTKLYSGFMWYDKQLGKVRFDFENPQLDKSQKQGELNQQEQSFSNDTSKKDNSSKQKLH